MADGEWTHDDVVGLELELLRHPLHRRQEGVRRHRVEYRRVQLDLHEDLDRLEPHELPPPRLLHVVRGPPARPSSPCYVRRRGDWKRGPSRWKGHGPRGTRGGLDTWFRSGTYCVLPSLSRGYESVGTRTQGRDEMRTGRGSQVSTSTVVRFPWRESKGRTKTSRPGRRTPCDWFVQETRSSELMGVTSGSSDLVVVEMSAPLGPNLHSVLTGSLTWVQTD